MLHWNGLTGDTDDILKVQQQTFNYTDARADTRATINVLDAPDFGSALNNVHNATPTRWTSTYLGQMVTDRWLQQ